uniref:Uncharacterized protein n=1 Tax=Quercus lobata TaxID=97700 RepID=A0A7N2LUD8_QUELO
MEIIEWKTVFSTVWEREENPRENFLPQTQKFRLPKSGGKAWKTDEEHFVHNAIPPTLIQDLLTYPPDAFCPQSLFCLFSHLYLQITPNVHRDQGCTDAAPRPAHSRPTRRDAATREGRRRPRVRPASCRVAPRGGSRLGPTRADAAKIGADAAEIGTTRPKSGRIGPYRPYRPYRPATDTADTAETGRIGRNRPKSAVKIAGEAEILASDAFLALFFLCFVNQSSPLKNRRPRQKPDLRSSWYTSFVAKQNGVVVVEVYETDKDNRRKRGRVCGVVNLFGCVVDDVWEESYETGGDYKQQSVGSCS